MKTSKISFTSAIRPMSVSRFLKETGDIPLSNRIYSPWTAKQIIKKNAALTENIYDCSAGGITNGKEVVMFHICTGKENRRFKTIENIILEKIKSFKNPQGFLLGSASCFEESSKLFKKFQNFMEKNKIPYSMFKGNKTYTHIAYDGAKDEWLIANPILSKNGLQPTETLLKQSFEDINICSKDFIID